MNDANRTCLNCGTGLHGEFCSHCGQRDKDLRLPVKELAGEFLDIIPSFDERLIRSLRPFLFSPGTLTLEYLSGKRKRYISPFNFYFFISFLFFFINALHIPGSSPDIPKSVVMPDSLQTSPSDSSSRMSISGHNSGVSFTIQDSNQVSRWFGSGFVDGFKSGRNNPQLFFDKIKEHMPKVVFLLLPVFALLLKLVYARSHILYVQHLVFSFYFHSFIFLVLLCDTFIEMLLPAAFHVFGSILLLTIPVYLFAGLRNVYGQGRGKTLVKVSLLLFSHGIVFLATIILLVVATILLFFR